MRNHMEHNGKRVDVELWQDTIRFEAVGKIWLAGQSNIGQSTRQGLIQVHVFFKDNNNNKQ